MHHLLIPPAAQAEFIEALLVRFLHLLPPEFPMLLAQCLEGFHFRGQLLAQVCGLLVALLGLL
jgi:hypothetical protein